MIKRLTIRIINIVALTIVLVPTISRGQSNALDTLSKGKFILHKFQQPIGKETYSIISYGDSLKLKSDFKFNDRGQDVPLQTTLITNKTGIPLYFITKGKTSRYSDVDSEVRIVNSDYVSIRVGTETNQVKIAKQYFIINGYSPVAIQMQLIKYWKEKGKPDFITTYPAGSVKIKFSGYDTVNKDNLKEILERYFVAGLIWGNEIIWTDQTGKLVALFTNDAEGDKFEAIDESYIKLLPSFISMAANYGMANFQLQKKVNNPVIALTNGNIVDVNNGNVLRNGIILIKDGIIQKVGQQGKIKIPKNTLIIDVSGKTILPGLWDMHAHFQQVEWGPAYLAAGVTTVRDCGNEFDFINSVKDAIDNNKGVGPRIIKAGIIDGDSPYVLGIIRANNSDEARAVVKKYKEAGYEQIKLYSSVKPEMIKAVADEAHKLGLSVTGHVPRSVSLTEAVKLGQNQINHIQYIYRAMLVKGQNKVVVTDSTAQSVLQFLKDNNVVVDPTLGIYEWSMRSLDHPLDTFEPGVNSITEDLKVIFRTFGLPKEKAEEAKPSFEAFKEIVLAMHRKGIPIVAGTDMMIPGYSLYREIELYHHAGLTPLEAIQTATIVPARVMKKDLELGTIDEGKKADLIILEGNPLDNISNIRKVTIVIKDGKIYDPKELRIMIDFKP